jgi:hypothetical protein
VAAHQQRVGADLHDRRLLHRAVHALAADQEQQIRRAPGHLLELLRRGIVAAEKRMARGEVGEDRAAGEHRRLQQLGQAHRLGLRAAAPHVIAEHEHRALRLGEPPRDRLDRLRARRPRPLDLVVRVLADRRLQPLAIQELGADGEIDRAGRRRGGLAQPADRGHADGLGIGVHLVGAARFLGDGPHRLGLREAGERRQPAVVLQLGGPVTGDHQQRGAGDLRVEELAGQLVRATHDVRDDHTDLAAEAVIAVGHRRHQPLVLADDQLLIAVLGQRREDAGLGRAGVREEVFDPGVLEGLDEQHPAGPGNRLAHWSPRRSTILLDAGMRRPPPFAASSQPGGPACSIRAWSTSALPSCTSSSSSVCWSAR